MYHLSETVLHIINRILDFQRGCSFAHVKVGFKIVTMLYFIFMRVIEQCDRSIYLRQLLIPVSR